MTNTTDRVGYIGLGDMGGPIAIHLAREGVDLTVLDLSASAVEALVAEGAKVATSARELAELCDVVALCVWNDQQVLDIILGEDGLLAGASAGDGIIVQSSVLPATITTVANAAAAQGVYLVDAPVSGNSEDRIGGTLTVFVGGDDASVARCHAVLDVIGEPVVHLGAHGAGEISKLINNTILQAARNVAIELVEVAAAFDIREDALFAVINESSGGAWALRNWQLLDDLVISGRGVQANQTREVLETAATLGIEMPLTQHILDTAVSTAERRIRQLKVSGYLKE